MSASPVADSSRVFPEFDPNQITGEVMYYKEIVTCANWYTTTNEAKKTMGVYASFFSPKARKPDKGSEGLNRYLGHLDSRLKDYDSFFNGEFKNADENELLDKWLKYVDDSRNETSLDNQFWAFLNGYLHQHIV